MFCTHICTLLLYLKILQNSDSISCGKGPRCQVLLYCSLNLPGFPVLTLNMLSIQREAPKALTTRPDITYPCLRGRPCELFGIAHQLLRTLSLKKSRFSYSKTSYKHLFLQNNVFLYVELCKIYVFLEKKDPSQGLVWGGSKSHEVIKLRLQSSGHLVCFRTAALLIIVAGLPTGLAGRVFLIQFSLVASGRTRASGAPLAR